ncbi:MAG: hypothetical protein AABY61_04385 [Nitrospirota bacterium]
MAEAIIYVMTTPALLKSFLCWENPTREEKKRFDQAAGARLRVLEQKQ